MAVLSAVVQDQQVRYLLRKSTTSERAASREEAKLAQLEVDSRTPLYDGCDPEVTRLSFTLELLKKKANNKWIDKSLDKHLKFLHNKVLPAGHLCPTSVEASKKIICPFDLPHIRYHACINHCIIYRGEHWKKPVVQCAMLLDTRRQERKLLRKLYGTFRSLPVCSGIS